MTHSRLHTVQLSDDQSSTGTQHAQDRHCNPLIPFREDNEVRSRCKSQLTKATAQQLTPRRWRLRARHLDVTVVPCVRQSATRRCSLLWLVRVSCPNRLQAGFVWFFGILAEEEPHIIQRNSISAADRKSQRCRGVRPTGPGGKHQLKKISLQSTFLSGRCLKHVSLRASSQQRRGLRVTAAAMGGRVILWFRNDLRLLDNTSVHTAARLVESGQASEVRQLLSCERRAGAEAAEVYTVIICLVQVVPLYCFDPRNYITTNYGHHKTGPLRAKFIRESVRKPACTAWILGTVSRSGQAAGLNLYGQVEDLKSSLKAIGSDLAVVLDKPENAIKGDTCSSATVDDSTGIFAHAWQPLCTAYHDCPEPEHGLTCRALDFIQANHCHCQLRNCQ